MMFAVSLWLLAVWKTRSKMACTHSLAVAIRGEVWRWGCERLGQKTQLSIANASPKKRVRQEPARSTRQARRLLWTSVPSPQPTHMPPRTPFHVPSRAAPCLRGAARFAMHDEGRPHVTSILAILRACVRGCGEQDRGTRGTAKPSVGRLPAVAVDRTAA